MYDYFYGTEAEQFSFYRIPKVLFTEEQFRNISTEAKVLYGLLLDRMSLSAKNGWLDKEKHVYIIFSVEDIMQAMGCANQKAGKLLYELEAKCGLIERKRQGLGKPNLIYVKNFITTAESHFKKCENHDSGDVKITRQESLKSHANNTENKKTEYSDTESFLFTSFRENHGQELKRSGADIREKYREIISENISYEILLQDFPYDRDVLLEILEIMVDTTCTTKSTIRISGDDKSADVVKSQLLKLDSEHIRFVMACLKDNTTYIRNMRQYLLATLYNAPLTIGNYFRSRVNHDMAEGLI